MAPVWLTVNTEKKENAAELGKYPVQAWPSYYVIDAAREKVVLRYVGGATVPQLQHFLDDGARAAGGASQPVEALAKADRLYADGKNVEAAAAYAEALAAMPPSSPSYSRTIDSYLFALSSSRQFETCAAVARDAYPRLKGTPSGAGAAGSGLDCSLSMKDDDPGKAGLVAGFAADVRELLAGPKKGLAADDVSALYSSLGDEREAAKDEAGARKVRAEWAAYLDGEAAKAKTPLERSVYDSHRLTAYVALGEPERAVAFLTQAEKDFPDDYNPPARLAIAYGAMKKYGEALAASDRAMKLAYGPRKLVVYRTRVDLLKKKGDAEAAKKTLSEMLAYAESLPKEQVSERTLASIRKQVEAAN